MNKVKVTVFTPTYNRAYTLERLYKSLLNQTSYDFEWLIVDDGSTDNTSELIKSFQNNHFFDVRYYKQENSGKHVAINNGVDLEQFDKDCEAWPRNDEDLNNPKMFSLPHR